MFKNKIAIKMLMLLLLPLILLVPGRLGLGQNPPQNPAAPFIEAGDRLYEQGKLKEALTAYEQALQADPKNQYVAFQILSINVKLNTGEKPVGPLPGRDYSKIVYELGPFYKDPVNKFALKYPKGWTIDNNDPYFNVKFMDPYYEAFIFVKAIPTPTAVVIGYEFQAQIESLVKDLAAQIPGVSLKYNNFEKLVNETVLRTEVHYRAGSNAVIINARFLADLDRLVIVAWVCPEKSFFTFRPWLEPSVASITLNPR